jgi:hypothetical protein
MLFVWWSLSNTSRYAACQHHAQSDASVAPSRNLHGCKSWHRFKNASNSIIICKLTFMKIARIFRRLLRCKPLNQHSALHISLSQIKGTAQKDFPFRSKARDAQPYIKPLQRTWTLKPERIVQAIFKLIISGLYFLLFSFTIPFFSNLFHIFVHCNHKYNYTTHYHVILFFLFLLL